MITAGSPAILYPLYLVIKNVDKPEPKALLIGLIAGAINAIGFLAYTKLIGWQGQDISRLIPITLTMTPIVIAVFGIMVFREPMTIHRIFGLILGISAIYLLSR